MPIASYNPTGKPYVAGATPTGTYWGASKGSTTPKTLMQMYLESIGQAPDPRFLGPPVVAPPEAWPPVTPPPVVEPPKPEPYPGPGFIGPPVVQPKTDPVPPYYLGPPVAGPPAVKPQMPTPKYLGPPETQPNQPYGYRDRTSYWGNGGGGYGTRTAAPRMNALTRTW